MMDVDAQVQRYGDAPVSEYDGVLPGEDQFARRESVRRGHLWGSMSQMEDVRTAFSAFADEWRPRIEKSLDELCPRVSPDHGKLRESMRYSLLSGGKRLRPLLCLLAAKACGADPAVAMTAGCAIEMVHAFSLIHDDLPCMDDDDLRRGKPTNHVVFGEATALLAGDALLSHALSILSDAGSIRVLGLATGEMIEGQMMDMAGKTSVDATFLDELNGKKTGALLRASLVLGAIAASADEKKQEALIAYGEGIGLAFQITDDLLDLTGDEKTAGKRLRKDADKGKKTYPAILGIDESRARVTSLMDGAVAALRPFGKAADELRGCAQMIAERTS